jgi:dTDP-4-dehydrorhamnose 3,5-epimerase
MEFRRLEPAGVVLVVPDVHRDPRGFFLETWHAGKYQEGGIAADFVQDNQSHSRRGALRGLHAQLQRPQGKLVRAVTGEIWDVAVDIRPGSPSFGRFAVATLSAENAHQLWVPPGFAHGFCVLSEEADVEYKCTTFYDPKDEIAIRFDDPAIGIPWPIGDPLLSVRDRAAPPLSEWVARLKENAR